MAKEMYSGFDVTEFKHHSRYNFSLQANDLFKIAYTNLVN